MKTQIKQERGWREKYNVYGEGMWRYMDAKGAWRWMHGIGRCCGKWNMSGEGMWRWLCEIKCECERNATVDV